MGELRKLRECGELLYGRRFPISQKGAAYNSYVRSAVLYGSEAQCQKDNEMGMYKRQKDQWREQCVE